MRVNVKMLFGCVHRLQLFEFLELGYSGVPVGKMGEFPQSEIAAYTSTSVFADADKAFLVHHMQCNA